MKRLLICMAMVTMLAACSKGDEESPTINQNENPSGLPEPQYNEIYYTTTDGQMLDLERNGVDAPWLNTVISHTHIGDGIFAIGFHLTISDIYDYMFYSQHTLKSVRLPDGVTKIGEGAFEECFDLKSITIPSSVTQIGSYAFEWCESLTSVTIGNSVTSIGGGAFYNCSSLTSVTIPNSVTSIGSYAFEYCESLTSVTIPNSVTSIGGGAFSGCSSLQAFYGKFASSDNRCLILGGVLKSFAPAGLTSYTIPNIVTAIGMYAFYYCRSLTSVTIPNSVTSIGSSAFQACSSLTNITIPNSVTEIGGDAFGYCRSLASVYCKPTTPPTEGFLVSGGIFDYNASDRKIYVPRASVNAYKQAEYWSAYADDIVGYDF